MCSVTKFSLCLVILTAGAAQPLNAQNFSPPGNSWSGGWGFQSATDRSVGLQRANAVRSAEQGQGPTTVVNTTNYYNTDNRSNYVDVTSDGEVTSDFQIGDRIDQNTNSVGSMNTGTTTIDIVGDNNAIVAENKAENTGCVDGSALSNTMTRPENTGSLGLSGLVNSGGTLPGFSSSYGNIASPLQDCTRK